MISKDSVQSDTVIIEAPAELVWNILLDFENYEKWNSFCPSIKVPSLKLGSPVDMMVNLGGNLAPQCEYITRLEPNSVIAWGMENKPDDPIKAVRTQTVTALSSKQCSYVTIDEFAGEAVEEMMELMAKIVEDGFNQCAYDLKAFAETQFNHPAKTN